MFFVNNLKTTDRINIELWPYDAKWSAAGHKLLF